MSLFFEDMLKLLAAVIAGGLIGIEREYRDKSAGFRTLIFICVGSTLFTMLSTRIAPPSDTARIAASIVSGVGFLGAGAILRSHGRITGLTTASTIWLTAAMGMSIGGGSYALAGAALGLTLLVLWLFPKVERAVGNLRDTRTYEVTAAPGETSSAWLEDLLEHSGLEFQQRERHKVTDNVALSWRASGHPAAHDALSKSLFLDERIKTLRVRH